VIRLGEIALPGASSKIEARRKVFAVVAGLTTDQITASRVAAACSELCRLSPSGAGSRLAVDLDVTSRAGVVLALTLENGRAVDPDGIEVAAFDELTALPQRDGVHFLRATKRLIRIPPPEEDTLTDLRAIVQERSRDELMADLQTKNVELEGHRAHLEETVRERTVQLREATDEAEAANTAKSQFLANMSHELRTPMNAILGYAEILIEDAEDTEQQDTIPDLEKILGAGKHLLALINDVLDLSKIEAGKMELYCEDFELRPLIEETAATVESLVAKNGNRLELELSDDLGGMHADLTKVRQSLFNLLSNASKFTTEGTISLAAQRQAHEGKDWFVLRVADTGIGVRPERLAAVFEEFSQADVSTTREYGGTGLGLPITKRFCEMMGGRIDAESEVGKGTTFTIHLPARVEPEPEPPDGEPAAAEIDDADTKRSGRA
jgi:signal transduction histidine kinase